MSDQDEMDFGVYATTACNHARRRNAPPVPDQDGLFDADGVFVICGRRQCYVEFSGEFAATVARDADGKRIPLTAIAPGRWDPVSILTACTVAHNNRLAKVDPHKARFTNPGGLDEFRIARIVGADGVVPYLSRGMAYAGMKSGDPTYSFDQIVFAQQKNTSH